jgi:AAA family ATPase
MFTIRPLAGAGDRSDLKGAFRVYLSSPSLVALKLRVGDLCQLRLDGSPPKPAVAWNAPQKIQDSVVQTTRTLQDLYGLKIGDKISIEKSQEPLLTLPKVKLREVIKNGPPLSEVDWLYWESYLQGALAKREVRVSLMPMP